MSKEKCCKKTSIGGQALIEGIMMRGPHKTVMAVRNKEGEIITEDMVTKQLKDKCKIFGWPIIRGAVSMVESLVFGYKALMKSAEISGMLDEEEDEKKSDTDESSEAEINEEADSGNTDGEKPEKKENGLLMSIIGAISMVLGVALAVALFIYLPNLLFRGVNGLCGEKITAFQAAFEGVLKIIIFIAYVAIVSLMKDIKRVFMYHGAEHKTIFCYEHGKELTVENIRTERRFHPRCGTSFLILMLIVSIVFYSIIARLFPDIAANRYIWMLLKIVCLPIIIGFGYELIKFCGRHDNIVTRIIAAPGVWVQHLTTKEPDDSMIEVAIVAMSAVIPENTEDDKW